MNRNTSHRISSKRLSGAGLAGALAVAVLTGCSGEEGSDEPAAETGAEDGQAIVISEFEYELPDSIEPGETVTVRNEDSVGHTVTSDEDNVFDVNVPGGEEASFTVPDEEGEFPFHCTPHPDMTATLVVGG